MSHRFNSWTLVFFLVLVLGTGWLWASQVPANALPQARPAEPAVGHPAPPLVLPTLDGATFDLESLRGTPVVLNFWATWCGPCQRELPALQAAAERYDGLVVFAGVDQGEEPEVVRPYVEQMGLTFVIPMDRDHEAARRYNVMGLPTTFFIDQYGVIRHIWTGEMNSIILAEAIARILP
jgi:thiol-disulfide isomerase/thioredoxin